MIRFSLRQFRTQAFVGFGAFAVLAIVLIITGPHLVHLYDTTVVNSAAYSDCGQATPAFLDVDHSLQIALGALVIVVPCIIGLFWGAPLIARELEAGTYRLAWTQSVTRPRWLAVKLSTVGLASMAVGGLVSLAVSWWSSPFDSANMSPFSDFDARGVVPVGYAAFGFALGITAGVLNRRTLPAMATTLVTFVVSRLTFLRWIRPHLVPPLHMTTALNGSTVGFGRSNGGPLMLFPGTPNLPNAWIYSAQLVDKSGHAITSAVVTNACPQLANLAPPVGPGGGPGQRSARPVPGAIQGAVQNCATKVGKTYHLVVTYQPERHYWPMQWIELGIYLAVSLGLASFCYWWIRRRIA